MRNVYRALLNRAGVATVLWATVQQLVVASSTYFIVQAIRGATAGHPELALRSALAFVASLIAVFVPNTLSVIWLQRWRLRAFAAFIERFIMGNSGRATYSHSRDKSRYESWLTNESVTVFETGTRTLYDIYQIFLSTVLNVGVIAAAIDPGLFFWYLAAGGILLAANLVFRKHIACAAVDTQAMRRGLADCMLSAWENIFVGNSYNLKNWRQRFKRDLNAAEVSAVEFERTRTIASSVAVTLALVVIALGNGLFLRAHQDDVAAFAALLVTLPRQLQVVQNIFAFFGLLLSWEGVRAQFVELDNILHLSDDSKDLSRFIKVGDISVIHEGLEHKYGSLQPLKTALLRESRGRFTLRGKNGAGKSTLLSLLAEATGEASFFLPSQFSDLVFKSDRLISHSDGNRMLEVFAENAAFDGVRYILLDEWDANLDGENIRVLDTAIDQLAENWTVIESRHRH